MSLVVLEGLDGSGKGTQTKLLAQALAERGTPLRQVTFPDYESPSSALVRMYLNGEFGSDPESVNAYAASAFYAVDRYASFQRDWKAGYLRGDLILCDRYATSNMCTRWARFPGRSGTSILPGWRILSMKGWAFPGRIWCSTWICPSRCPNGCC